MTWSFWMAIAVTVLTVWALIKRYETRLVLLTSGLFMALVSLKLLLRCSSLTNP